MLHPGSVSYFGKEGNANCNLCPFASLRNKKMINQHIFYLSKNCYNTYFTSNTMTVKLMYFRVDILNKCYNFVNICHWEDNQVVRDEIHSSFQTLEKYVMVVIAHYTTFTDQMLNSLRV